MKKILLLFIILISFFTFDISFKETSYKEYATKKYIPINIQDTSSCNQYQLRFEVDQTDKEEFVSELLAFLKTKTYSATITTKEKITLFNEKTDQYLYAVDQDLIQKLYTIKEGNTIDFGKNSNDYYTTDLNDKKSQHHIVFLDKNYNKTYNNVYTVRPITQIVNSEMFLSRTSINVSVYVKGHPPLEDEVNDSPLYAYFLGSSEAHDEMNPEGRIDTTLTLRLLVVVCMSILLISICFIIQNRKEILLRKIQGMSSLYITKKLFMGKLCGISFLYLLTQLICYFVFIGNFYKNSVDFLLLLMKQFLVFLLFMCAILMILFIIVKSVNDISGMKKEKVNRNTIGVNLLLKIVAMVLLMSPTIIEINQIWENARLYAVMDHEKEHIKNQVYIAAGGFDLSPGGFKKAQKLILTYFNQNGGIYQNFEQKIMDEMSGLEESKFPYIEVNTNFLKSYHLTDAEGKAIDLTSLNNRTVLIPEKYKDDDIAKYTTGDFLFIKDGYEFTREGIPSSYESYAQKDPIIKVYTVYDEEEYKGGYGSFFNILELKNKGDLDKLQTFLDKEGLSATYSIKKSADDYEVITYHLKNQIMFSIMIILIQIVTILLFLVESATLVIHQNRKLYAIRYIDGDHFFERYFDLFMMNMIVYFVLLVTGLWLYQLGILQILGFISCVFLLETAILYVLVKRFERNSIVKTLKGE